ncbi:MAG: cytochrome P450 [Deltaproteobacteria bacterium]|nr:cytochrome P450 [Deltaproteobacteria bacterium]
MANHPIDADIRLADGDFYSTDPHKHFAWMRRHAPLYWDEKGSVWGVTRYDDVMQISKDSETFCNRHGMRPDSPPMPSMINLDDPDHKRRRALVNKGFTANRVRAHEPKVREICVDLIERAAAKGRFDFVRDIAAPLPMIMIGDMLGVEPQDRDDLLRWSDDLILGATMTAPMEYIMAAQRAFEEYGAYHRKVVADRRAQPRDDLMSVLVHANIDGDTLSDDALLHESLLILVGGDETTRHVISGGMYQLLLHPDQMHKLAADPARVPTAVEEMLRWVTPIQNMARTATRDVELHGQTIREGDKVLLLYPSANRDEDVFADPFRFDIERQPNEHLAFGGYGAHFCLGASLARLELRMMFEEIARRLPRLRLVHDEPPPLRPSNFIVGIEEMPVSVD